VSFKTVTEICVGAVVVAMEGGAVMSLVESRVVGAAVDMLLD